MLRVAMALTAVTLAQPAAAANSRHELRPQQVTALRALITTLMTEQRAPGASFAIGLDGELLWSEGFGLADVENNVRATPLTAYRSASIGKPMTATAVMALSERGNLDLDAPVQKYCPAFPQKAWPITTRELLSHTSGIREPNEDSELYNTRHYERIADALAIFAQDPLTMEPGTDFRYTSWGYVLLGCVLEGATGEEYRALMKHAIFVPAKRIAIAGLFNLQDISGDKRIALARAIADVVLGTAPAVHRQAQGSSVRSRAGRESRNSAKVFQAGTGGVYSGRGA